MPTPADYAADLAAAELDNVELLRLVQEAIANRSGLIVSPVDAPADPGSDSYLEVLVRIRDGRTLEPLAPTVAIETLIRAYTHSGANWTALVNAMIELASAARTSYAAAIIEELGPP